MSYNRYIIMNGYLLNQLKKGAFFYIYICGAKGGLTLEKEWFEYLNRKPDTFFSVISAIKKTLYMMSQIT